jgi:hypothetical protein
MTDENKLIRDASRGAAAKALADNELLQEAFTSLEARYVEEWRITQFRDTDARERLWQAVNILRKVRDHLGAMIANGKLAQAELEMLSTKKTT